jgi:hypothetical protein
VRVFSRETVDDVICVESLERAFSKEAGDESSRAKGHKEGIATTKVSHHSEDL